MAEPAPSLPPTSRPTARLWRKLIGAPRDVADPQVLHHVSLVAFLAWVGLGADGLSSSAYGPEEAYKALGGHSYLALFLVAMTAVTITVISIAYSNVIEHFPGGGGGDDRRHDRHGHQPGEVRCELGRGASTHSAEHIDAPHRRQQAPAVA